MRLLTIAAIAAVAVSMTTPCGAAEPDVDTLYARQCADGAKAAAAGRVDMGVMTACRQSLMTEPLSAEQEASVRTNRGVIYSAHENFDEAISDFTAALSKKSDFVPAYVNRAAAYLAISRDKEAYADADRAIHIDPKSARAYYLRGAANEHLAKTQAAYVDYTMAARLDPNWQRPREELARFKLKSGA